MFFSVSFHIPLLTELVAIVKRIGCYKHHALNGAKNSLVQISFPRKCLSLTVLRVADVMLRFR